MKLDKGTTERMRVKLMILRTLSCLLLLSFRPVHTNEESDGPGCQLALQDGEGVINSPKKTELYGKELNCIFDLVKTQEDQCGVRLSYGFCKTDWIGIDSCVPEGGSRFCGNISTMTYEYPFQKDAEAFRIIFHSDNYNEAKSFRISYKLINDCSRHDGLFWNPPYNTIPEVFPADTPCFTQVTERKGTINTPWYPENYPNNMDCIYEFVRLSPFICGVRMKALTFELDNPVETQLGGACLDFFHQPGCGFLCGNIRFIWVAKFQPGATSMKFHFHSDEKDASRGFQLAFEQIYNC